MKKQTITNKEIEADIINALKRPAYISQKSYLKSALPPLLIAACLLILSEFIYPPASLWILLVELVGLVGYMIFCYLHRSIRIKKVTINDYDITTDILSHKTEEHYQIRNSKLRHTKTINNYSLHFESGKTWRISKDNHFWSKECPMSDAFIHENAHRGDTFILVVKRDTGKIAMAYSTELFEYKN